MTPADVKSLISAFEEKKKPIDRFKKTKTERYNRKFNDGINHCISTLNLYLTVDFFKERLEGFDNSYIQYHIDRLYFSPNGERHHLKWDYSPLGSCHAYEEGILTCKSIVHRFFKQGVNNE